MVPYLVRGLTLNRNRNRTPEAKVDHKVLDRGECSMRTSGKFLLLSGIFLPHNVPSLGEICVVFRYDVAPSLLVPVGTVCSSILVDLKISRATLLAAIIIVHIVETSISAKIRTLWMARKRKVKSNSGIWVLGESWRYICCGTKRIQEISSFLLPINAVLLSRARHGPRLKGSSLAPIKYRAFTIFKARDFIRNGEIRQTICW